MNLWTVVFLIVFAAKVFGAAFSWWYVVLAFVAPVVLTGILIVIMFVASLVACCTDD